VKLASGDRLRFDVEEFDFRVPSAAPAVDDGKTQYREPASAVVDAASSGMYKRPGAWADPDAMGDGANKTKFIDPAQLKQMINNAPAAAVNTAAIDGPHLHVVSGSRAGLNIKLTVGESGVREWTIGSQADREVQFQDSGVSALHAKVVNEGERWKVLDQMSANGTYVNGKRSNVSYLTAGDRVRFGPVECVFQISPRRCGAAPVCQLLVRRGWGGEEQDIADRRHRLRCDDRRAVSRLQVCLIVAGCDPPVPTSSRSTRVRSIVAPLRCRVPAGPSSRCISASRRAVRPMRRSLRPSAR
jgi:hypothetical protein